MSRYPSGMTLRPLIAWPGQRPNVHVRSPFSAALSTTLTELDRELWHLGDGQSNAPSVLELALRENDLRNDGMPRADAKITHPGVVLRIDSNAGPLSYPAAKFSTWQDNLRAITLGLNGLRRLDRYGITPGREQYTGWRQLTTGAEVSTPNTSDAAEQALRTVADMADEPLPKVYRTARATSHPDRHGGDRRDWDRVEAAAEVLRRAGRLPS